MATINILTRDVYNQISAGEVVERPSSIVKEMFENSIDAGAKNVTIQIENGGINSITIQDDGCGIPPSEFTKVFLPHATSKILKADDIQSVKTLGFRGEAMSAISSVSKIKLISKTEDADVGSYAVADGGLIIDLGETPCETGTTFIVTGVFYNTPARLKFLKKPKSEEREITTLVEKLILSNPNVAIKYYADGKLVLQSFGDGLESAIIAVYSKDTMQNCIQIQAEKNGVKVEGFLGNINFYKSNKTYQTLIINGRVVTDNVVQSAVQAAYSSYLMKRQYPFYVLILTVPTDIVDVNVHPRKAEVRFSNNQLIYGSVYTVVTSVLDGSASAVEIIKKPVDKRLETPIFKEEKIKPQSPKTDWSKQSTFKKEKPGIQSGLLDDDYEKECLVTDVRPEELALDAIGKGPSYLHREYVEVHSGRLPYPQAMGFTSVEEYENSTFYKTAINLPDDFEPLERPNFELQGKPKTYIDEFGRVHSMNYDIPKRKKKKKNDDKVEDHRNRCVDLTDEKYIKENGLDADLNSNDEEYFRQIKIERDKQAEKRFLNEIEFCSQLFGTYLVFEFREDVFIVDQHAAHERVLYDNYMEKARANKVEKQMLLIPFQFTVNAAEYERLFDLTDYLNEIGFDTCYYDETSYCVYSVPAMFDDINVEKFFFEVINDPDIMKGDVPKVIREKMMQKACKAAIKAGDRLDPSEIESLMLKIKNDFTLKCPHGRPVAVKISRTELEKWFKRIV